MAEKKELHGAELEEWYENYRDTQRKQSRRYRKKQQLLKEKLAAAKITVTDEELDEALADE